ncbi:carbohydrate porin [Aliidongia dinghuensis]|nr:carbohydrate porin [Aliidongia dinghuensis]
MSDLNRKGPTVKAEAGLVPRLDAFLDRLRTRYGVAGFVGLMLVIQTLAARADDQPAPGSGDEGADWSNHYQLTYIEQGNPAFTSPYRGPNSLDPGTRTRETISATAMWGYRLLPNTELYFNPEFNQGFGLSHTFGLAGFPNGDAQKAGADVPKLNIARLYIKQTIGLGGETEEVEDDLNQIAGRRDIARITIWAGKLAVNDIFDTNSYAHDSRNDFFNWAIWEGGAYDYAADQKGYTDGVAIELNQKSWAVRLGDFLVPKFSNDRDLDTNFLKRGGYQAEFEQRYQLFDHDGKARVTLFANRANMGSYAAALQNPTIDITASRTDRWKYGFVLGAEQGITDDLGAFARFSYNDGQSEIISFTDISRSASAGISLKGTAWDRPTDTVGLAGAVNALSRVQADYFKAGGLGILIGDGKLTYGTEDIVEGYYRYQVSEPISLTFDGQFINNPAYNTDRGPVWIFAVRLHVQI